MTVKNTVIVVFLLLIIGKVTGVFAQEEVLFADSTSFADFLIKQGEIPGLQFQLVDPTGKPLLDSSASPLVQLVDFSRVITLKDSITTNKSIIPSIQFQIFTEVSTFQAVQEYVSILLVNGELEPIAEELLNGQDLISLASKERYSPLWSGTYYSHFNDFKVFMVVLTISMFFLFAFFMILYMLIFKARRNRSEKLKALYDEQIVGPLSEILFEKNIEELVTLSNEELYQYFPEKQLKKAIYVQVLVERILALNKKMKGDFKTKLKALYKRLALDHVSIKKLNSSKWDIVVTGLVEINEMDMSEALEEVKKHVNSSNFYIRSQAVATVLNLSHNVDLSFLRDQTFPLSRWQQMNYLRIIKYLNPSRELHINSLFNSKNQSIRLFGYKLVRVLGLVNLLAELEGKFDTVSDDEKIEILKAFEYLGVPAHFKLIDDGLRSSNTKLVSIAAKAAGTIGDENNKNTICEILNTEPAFGLKIVLLKSLQKLDREMYNQVISKDEDPDLQRINLSLLDPLLQDV